jgi:hypothetical protein
MSERAALGKTSMINLEAKEKNLKVQKILLGGFPNGELMIKAHKRFIKNYIQSIDSNKGREEKKNENEKLSFCYFLSEPHSSEELSRLLFDILVFGTIRDENSD